MSCGESPKPRISSMNSFKPQRNNINFGLGMSRDIGHKYGPTIYLQCQHRRWHFHHVGCLQMTSQLCTLSSPTTTLQSPELCPCSSSAHPPHSVQGAEEMEGVRWRNEGSWGDWSGEPASQPPLSEYPKDVLQIQHNLQWGRMSFVWHIAFPCSGQSWRT